MNPPAPRRASYAKPWLSYSDQLELLRARGLVVEDRAAAEAFLAHVNYYRFSGYLLAFERSKHVFHDGYTFENIRATYEFDLGLRDLVTDALEILEVDCRAAMAHHFGQTHGAFGHVEPRNFYPAFRHGEWLRKRRDEAERSSETFVEHFRSQYPEFPDLPIWMLMEVMSFGALSQMYKGMHRQDQRAVAARYRMQADHLGTVFHHLAYVRNLCAHHARLWNRVWAIRPALPKGKDWLPPGVPGNDRLFASLLLQYQLMKRCPGVATACDAWRRRVIAHLDAPPPVANAHLAMGMPPTWKTHSLWE